MQINIAHQKVVVVGGTSGINRGIAEAFAAEGCHVAVVSRSQEKVDNTVSALRKLGASSALGATADVREFDQLDAALSGFAEEFGEFDTVVSGAAGNFPALAQNMSPNGFKAVMEIDLLGSFHVVKAIENRLKKPGGSLVHISAPQSLLPMAGQIHVCAAKAGVDMLTRTLALEWGRLGLRVNSVIPGPIAGTEGEKRLLPTKEMQEACRLSVPLERFGTPADIASACLFLASDMASYINGAVVPVDGGWSLGGASASGAMMEPFLQELKKPGA